MTIDFDDQGSNHIISDMCQSHDARDKLDELHYVNPNFKTTLFAIPGEMTLEMLKWFDANKSWVELAVHGFYHTSNYECEKMSYEVFDGLMNEVSGVVEDLFVKGFKAPGWQISDGAYEWLVEHDWWVADQAYNNKRRPEGLPAYVNASGTFFVGDKRVEAWHGHTHDHGVDNGIYMAWEVIKDLVKNADSFQFVSEVL